MKPGADCAVDDGIRASLRGLAALALLCPGLAFGAAAPEEAPLPEPPPLAEAGAGAPERAPMPLPRPGGTNTDPPPTTEASGEPSGTEPPPPRPSGRTPAEVAAVTAPAPEGVEPEPPGAGAVPIAPLPPVRPGLNGSSLIGIFSLTTGRTALLRFPSGDVRRVSVGDRIDGWEVSSITSDSLRVTRSGRERIFVLTGN